MDCLSNELFGALGETYAYCPGPVEIVAKYSKANGVGSQRTFRGNNLLSALGLMGGDLAANFSGRDFVKYPGANGGLGSKIFGGESCQVA